MALPVNGSTHLISAYYNPTYSLILSHNPINLNPNPTGTVNSNAITLNPIRNQEVREGKTSGWGQMTGHICTAPVLRIFAIGDRTRRVE